MAKNENKMDLEQISSDNIKVGILKAIENSESLIQEGSVLFELKRFPRAFSLFQFSNEELGKAILLFSILIWRKLGKKIDYKKYNKVFFEHQSKHRYSVGIEFTAMSMIYSDIEGNKKERLKEIITKLQKAQAYDNLKNASLYINLTDDGFKTPFEQIEKQIVVDIKNDAELRYQLYSSNINQRLDDLDSIAEYYAEFEKEPVFDEDFVNDLNQIIEDE
ncbi:MAG: AbiV family abortive infection protein [Bacteroidales bacterium]|nr:AbiV family abortive infection protein [Bacteroidales bacterium]